MLLLTLPLATFTASWAILKVPLTISTRYVTAFTWRAGHRFCYWLFHSRLEQRTSICFQPPNECLFYNLSLFFLKSIFYWLGKKWPLWQTLSCNLYFIYVSFSCIWNNFKYFQPRNFTVSKQQHVLYLMICEWFPVCIYVLFWFCFCVLLAHYFSQFIWWCYFGCALFCFYSEDCAQIASWNNKPTNWTIADLRCNCFYLLLKFFFLYIGPWSQARWHIFSHNAWTLHRNVHWWFWSLYW